MAPQFMANQFKVRVSPYEKWIVCAAEAWIVSI